MNRICAIHQPNFLPWLGYFYKIAKADVFVLLDNVDILTGSAKAITNRTKIKTNVGEQWITVPIKKTESKRILDIETVDNLWRTKMLKTIKLAYSKSPFFDTIYPLVEDMLSFDSHKLSIYNTEIIKAICGILGIETNIVIASELNITATERNQRIIDICKTVDCSIYFSGKGGTKYHDSNQFQESGIQIAITDFVQKPYPQIHGDFIGGLSIIDYLFNNKPEIWK